MNAKSAKKIHKNQNNMCKSDEDLIRIRTITDKKTGGSIRIVSQPDECITKQPREYYRNMKIIGYLFASGISHEEIYGEKANSEDAIKAFVEAKLLWQNVEKEVNNIELPMQFIKLLSTYKKSDQEKLLRGMIFTPIMLAALIFEACEKHGYTLRNIRHDIPQKGLDVEKMPAVAIMQDRKVKKMGKTDLSEGQIIQAVEHRKVTLAKFLEKEDHWHCFFTNFKNLRGEETWQGEKQPHYHYISDSFEIPKEEVIKQLKSDKYNLGNLPHIKLKGYGKQPDE